MLAAASCAKNVNWDEVSPVAGQDGITLKFSSGALTKATTVDGVDNENRVFQIDYFIFPLDSTGTDGKLYVKAETEYLYSGHINVAAAQALVGAPAIVVSLRTTTNIEVVDPSGAYLGGTIAPGLMLGVRALSGAAARLPLVELRAPSSVIGRNTREAMQSGVVLGEVASIDGLIDAISDELGCEAPVVVCGHHAEIIVGLMRHEAMVEDALTLRGLAQIWYANRG